MMEIGDTVTILNRAGPKFIIEGKAKLLNTTITEGRWIVRFENGDVVQRFVDPAAQNDPKEYVKQLNASIPSAS